MVATSHIWLFKLSKIKFSSSVALAMFQGLNSPMWLETTMLDSVDTATKINKMM